jgi:hypothetical protein
VRLGVFGAFGLEWFDIVVPHFVLHILLVNFSWIVSASGCRHILPNHLNLGVLWPQHKLILNNEELLDVKHYEGVCNL